MSMWSYKHFEVLQVFAWPDMCIEFSPVNASKLTSFLNSYPLNLNTALNFFLFLDAKKEREGTRRYFPIFLRALNNGSNRGGF